MKKCPNCGKEVKDNLSACTKCGKKLFVNEKKTENTNKSSNGLGIVVGIIAVVAILVLYNVSAIAGMILYLIAFGIAITDLKKDSEFSTGNYVNYCKGCFNKEKILSKGIPLIIVILIPLIVIISIYRWIYADTIRSINSIYDSIGGTSIYYAGSKNHIRTGERSQESKCRVANINLLSCWGLKEIRANWVEVGRYYSE